LNNPFNYEPFPHQKIIHTYCDLKNPALFILVNGGRQSGKSKSLLIQCLVWGFGKSDELIWYVLPSETQCQKVYTEMLNILGGTGYLKSHTGSRGDIRITLWNNTRIEFKSSQMENSLRGASVGFMIIDEAAFIPKDIVETILLPTLNVKGRKCLIASTPRGKNWFYDYYKLSTTNDKYKSITFTYKDNPLCNLEIINVIKSQIPENAFKQEYLAEFIEGGSVFSCVEQVMTIQVPMSYDPKRTYYFGIDLGLVRDFTVITILNDLGEMVDVIRFTGKDSKYVEEKIKETILEWKPKKTLVEYNGIGIPIYQHLYLEDEIRANTKLEQFITGNKSKNQIISNLISAMETDKIKLLNNPILKGEMTDFSYEFSASGNIIFSSYSDHDDMVMSLAIAYEALNGSQKIRNKYTIMTV
jgi:hypothetical protein